LKVVVEDGKGGHLVDIPVFQRAAVVMRRQQDWLRRSHPQWFDEAGKPLNADLRLWPKSTNNRDGTVPLSGSVVNSWIRQWVGKGARYHAAIQRTPKIVGPDVMPFPLARITAYALRHTFGQDLHDAGVPLDTIQKLMGHDHIMSTQVYACDHGRSVERAQGFGKAPVGADHRRRERGDAADPDDPSRS
jgi:integrase